jgi:hypothetical protein
VLQALGQLKEGLDGRPGRHGDRIRSHDIAGAHLLERWFNARLKLFAARRAEQEPAQERQPQTA